MGMIAGLLGVVGTLLPILPVLVALVGGQWALRAMRRSPINERSDRRLRWMLQFNFIDGAGQDYLVELPIDIRAP
jgi:hypothetical protein